MAVLFGPFMMLILCLSQALRRIVRAIVESRQRQTDREIARFLARSGGRLTDDMERRLTQHLLSRNCIIRD